MNWDRIPSGQFDATVAALQSHGHPVYLMLDSVAERDMFEARHGPVLDRSAGSPTANAGTCSCFWTQ